MTASEKPPNSVSIPVLAAIGKPSASRRSPLDRLSVNSDRSYAGRLVSRAFPTSANGSRVEYAVEAALEIALTRSVKLAAGSAATDPSADSSSVKLGTDKPGSSNDVHAVGSFSSAVMPSWVSVASVLSTVDRLTSGNSPHGVATFDGESASTE